MVKQKTKKVKGELVKSNKGHIVEAEMLKYKDTLLTLKKKHNRLTVPIVLREAKKPNSKIHNVFIWDDTIAGEKYREMQAQVLINNVYEIIVYRNKSLKQKIFYGVTNKGKTSRFYVTKTEVMKNASHREELLEKCINHMENTTMFLKMLKGEL